MRLSEPTKLRPAFMGPADPGEYDKWFRAQVQAAIDDPRPSIPHAQAMAEVRAALQRKQQAT